MQPILTEQWAANVCLNGRNGAVFGAPTHAGSGNGALALPRGGLFDSRP